MKLFPWILRSFERYGNFVKTCVSNYSQRFPLQVDSNADLVQISSYDDNLKRWLEYYPLDKFLILENKDLASNPVRSK